MNNTLLNSCIVFLPDNTEKNGIISCWDTRTTEKLKVLPSGKPIGLLISICLLASRIVSSSEILTLCSCN